MMTRGTGEFQGHIIWQTQAEGSRDHNTDNEGNTMIMTCPDGSVVGRVNNGGRKNGLMDQKIITFQRYFIYYTMVLFHQSQLLHPCRHYVINRKRESPRA